MFSDGLMLRKTPEGRLKCLNPVIGFAIPLRRNDGEVLKAGMTCKHSGLLL